MTDSEQPSTDNVVGSRPSPFLEAFQFEKEELTSFEQVRDEFEWDVPEVFNAATYLCDRWGDDQDTERTAMTSVGSANAVDQLTYTELKSRSGRLANVLRSSGVSKGDRVALSADQIPSTLVSFISIWKVGAVAVPLSPKYGTSAIEYRLSDCDVDVCISTSSNIEEVREIAAGDDGPISPADIIVVDIEPRHGERGYSEALEEASTAFETRRTKAADPAFIIYTSGTTGPPKGVVHAHRSLLGMLPTYALSMCNGETKFNHVAWVPAAWSWIASLSYVFPALFYGHSLMGDANDRFDPIRSFRNFIEYNVSVAFIPHPVVQQWQEELDPTSRCDSLRVAMFGGMDKESTDWLRQTFPNAVVHKGYGQSEACLPIGHCKSLFSSPEKSIGRAMPGHTIRTLDPETGEPVKPGEIGELAIRYDGDPACLDGYWERPEKFSEKVRDGWLWTGDLGRIDEDANIYFTSRKDDVIKSSGYRIGPGEIESELRAHPVIEDVGVIGIPDDARGEVPVAYVTVADGFELSEDTIEELQTHVKEQYAAYAYPRRITAVEELPRTSNGKVRRVELKDRSDAQ